MNSLTRNTISGPILRSIILSILMLTAIDSASAADDSLADLVQTGNREAALEMIRLGANVNERQGDGTTALHWAVYSVDAELVKELLSHEASPNMTNNFGSKPLTEAIKLANIELAKLLLDGGAHVDSPNQDGQTALMLAAGMGTMSLVELLVENGADINAVEKYRGQTALMWASSLNYPKIAAYLIKHGADVTVRSTANDWPSQITSEPRAQYRAAAGLTAFHYAARSGCQGCAVAMLKAGANIARPTPEGVTPLLIALENKHFDFAKYLLNEGANPHVWDWWGRTPLYAAVEANSSRPRGFRAAAPPTLVIKNENSALDIVALLFNAGVNPNPQLNMHRPGRGGGSGRFTDDLLTIGATPLMKAALAFDVDAIKVLLANDALVDLPNAMGVTPLMAAAGVGSSMRDPGKIFGLPDTQTKAISTLDVLLEAGAEVNTPIADISGHTARIARPSTMTERGGQTALYGAVKWAWIDVVEYLIAHGAVVDMVDDLNKSPIDASQGNIGGRDNIPSEEIESILRKAI